MNALRFVFLALLLAAGSVAAKADPLIVSSSQTTRTVTPNESVVYIGNITNPGAQNVSITGAFPTLFSGSSYGANFQTLILPGLLIMPGQTLQNVPIFRFDVLSNPVFGNYPAIYYLESRISGTQLPIEGSNNLTFTIRVQPSNPDPIPEPATMILLGTGLASIGGVIKRRRNK